MSSEEIRESFLNFFEKKRHKIVPSSSLIPDDPSVLFTTAGMQQFKPYFLGLKDAVKDFDSRRLCSVQKCFRTSDIDEVGETPRHLTFFEMLGNFSFGDYFKEKAIEYAYEFIIKELGLKIDYVSVFGGDEENNLPADEESEKIWKKIAPEIEIKKFGKEDNFWGPTGEEGPCGPTTEIYIYGVEIWNIVFNEYYKNKEGEFEKLKNPGVDTGMGLERLTTIIQSVNNIFETDIFQPLISKINEFAPNLNQRAMRILADHLRASIFLISDGIRPSNKEAGYILRRLLRRILAYSVKYDIHADLFAVATEIIKEKFGKIYPEVKEIKMILKTIEEEKRKFQEAIAEGIKKIDELNLANIQLTGQIAFDLYQTYGLPLEISQELIKGKSDTIKEDFEREFEKHQQLSRTASAGIFKGGLVDENEKTIKYHTATHLLLESLRRVLGGQISQKGSNITSERLRLDFSYPEKLTAEQVKQVEDLVNQKIQEDLAVKMEEMSVEQAKKQGAIGVFEERYGEKVKVYAIGDFSKEICGGPHIQRTGELGHFKIIKEEASSSGVRRIKAVLD